MRHLIAAIIFLCTSLCVHAQFKGLVVNEVASDYVELVVVGTRTCQDSTADISGWVIDDNNGWFGAGVGKGISVGHIRFSTMGIGPWASMPFGSIILIYKTPANPKIQLADDPYDGNKDHVYVLSIGSDYFDQDNSEPALDFGLTNFIYPDPALPAWVSYPQWGGASWNDLDFNPFGDAVIIVNPHISRISAEFALAWGSANGGAPTIYKPVSLNYNLYLKDSAYTVAADWIAGNATNDETPGGPNSTANATWINSMLAPVTPPVLKINSPASVCAPATVNLTIPAVTSGSSLSFGTQLTYWADAAATQPLPNPNAIATSGTYYIKAATSGTPSCIDIEPVTVTISNPSVPIVSIQNTCSGYSILSVSNQDPNGTISWSNGVNGVFQNVLEAGTYSVTQIVNGCTSTATTIIANPGTTPVKPAITVTNNCDGTSTLVANGVVNGNSILWSNGATGNTITVTTIGNYSVVQSLSGCTSAASATVTTSPHTTPPAPGISFTSLTCGQTTENITITSSVTGLLFSLDGSGFGAYPATGYSVNAGAHTLTALNAAGCSSSTTITINAAPNAPQVPSLNITQPPCGQANGNIAITSSVAGLQFSLDGALFGTYPITGYTVSPGTHTLTVKNASACFTAVSAIINPTPVIPPSPLVSVTDNCNGTSVLTASNYTGNLLWSNGATGNSITITTPGNYSVTQTVNGCTSTPTVAVASPKTAPPAPTISVINNCDGTSSLTASNYAGNLLWSNAAINNSISVTIPGNYSITQTVNGCTSSATVVTASPKTTPPAPNVAVANNCDGTSVLTASNYTGSLLWSNGATGNSITVTAPGNYSVTQTVNSCTSTPTVVVASPKTTPLAPIVTVVNNCDGTSVLTASNYTGSLLWSNGATNNSINVTTPGNYSVSQTVNGCTSSGTIVIASPKTTPAAPNAAVANNCDGTSVLIASNYTGSLLWSNGSSGSSISVTMPGNYSLTQTVNGCISASSVTVTASPKTPPPAPTVSVVDNCDGTSVLTASNYTGNLLWNNGATGSSISVTAAGNYSVIQTVNGCISASSVTVTASPKTPPPAPAVTIANTCNSISVLTATGIINGATVLWSTGASGNSISVTTPGNYSVTQTINGCTSSATVVTASPSNTLPAPIVSVVDNCDGTSILTASNYTGNLLWSNGASGNPISITIPGNYSVTQTVNGCSSTLSVIVTASPKTPPPAPTVSVVDNCDGTSILTASNYTGNLLWSNGASGNPISITTIGNYSVTQTVNGCSSASSVTVTASPKTSPPAPAITVINNCDGTSVLTASNYTGNLLWSNGASGSSVTVIAPGNYSAMQTVNGCTSTATVVTASPKTPPPAPTVSVIDNCDGTSVLTASNYTGNLLWSNGATASSISVTTPGNYSVTQTVNGCTSTATIVTASPKTPPPAPTVSVIDNCDGTSVLTASNYTGNLLWSNGANGNPITVTTPGNYFVTQTVNGCTSTATTVKASPKTTPLAPSVTVVSNCDGTAVLTASNYTGNLLWSNGATGNPITITTSGNYFVTQTVNGCTSAQSTMVAASPKIASSAPSVIVGEPNCTTPSGSINITAPAGNGFSYSINGTDYQSATVFSNLAPGTYNVTVKNNGGCISLGTPAIINQPASAVSVSVNAAPIPCGQSTGSISISGANGIAPYSYSLDGSIFGISNTFSNLIAGLYQVTVKDANGCMSKPMNVTLNKIPPFNISLSADKNSVLPGTWVHLNSSSTTPYTILSWTPGNVFQSQSSLSQSFLVDSSMSVSIIAQSNNGCLDTASVNVKVIPLDDVYIPSGFTPNGDGKNDVLRVLGSNIKELDFKVFNRWGQLVFVSNDQGKGWDGTLAGKAQAPDVFVYVVVAKLNNGSSVTKKGTVTLIR